jgi:hypothetical protein
VLTFFFLQGGGITLNYGIIGKHRNRLDGYLAYAPLVLLHVSLNDPFEK